MFIVLFILTIFYLQVCTLSADEYVPVFKGNKINFYIKKSEVSNEEYCRFLNACARLSDPYQLWNPLMQEHYFGGINREIRDGEFHYKVKPGYEKLPVSCVSWTSAARYCNYLSYGKPDTGKSELGTTEGNSIYGTYNTQDFNMHKFIRSKELYKRNTSTAYFLPSIEEWRLAAWGTEYPKGKSFQATDSNVYLNNWRSSFPHLMPVDSNKNAPSYSGALNQGGNVAEWVESKQGNFFLALGGSCIRGKYSLKDSFTEGDEADKPIPSFGIRPARAVNPVRLTAKPISDTPTSKLLDTKNDKFVKIGHPGNPSDPLYHKGRVNYTFELSKYPLTNKEYCDFLNHVATQSDPYGLFNQNMTDGVCGGIERIKKKNGNFFYRPKSGYSDRPVVYIGFHDAMRYCNWLHYGKPKRPCGPMSTEGTASEGAYNTEDCQEILEGRKEPPNNYGKRNPTAKYFIPTDDEWYKAGYYDPERLGGRQYHDYPLRTSSLPANKPDQPFSCNYIKDNRLGVGAPFYLAKVTEYPGSDTYFGCRQMAGNIWEYVEPNQISKGINLRGGSFGYTEFGMGAWNCDLAGITDELNCFGVRIARQAKQAETIHPPKKELLREWMKKGSVFELFLYIGSMIAFISLGCILGTIFFMRYYSKTYKKVE